MAARKGLGRNLDALLGSKSSIITQPVARDKEQLKLPIESLQRGKYQPRQHIVEDQALQELAASIKAQGIIQPIVVRTLAKQRYEILAGERRWRAAQLAGLTEVPVVVREVDDNAAIAISLIENIQREDLNPIEEAYALDRLINEFSLTHQQAADAVGRSRTAVSNLLRLMNLSPGAKRLLECGDLDMGHARALLPLDAELQEQVAKIIVQRELTVRETEREIRRMQNAPNDTSSTINSTLSAAYTQLQQALSTSIGSKVALKPGRKESGKLVIHYKNKAELDRIIAQFEGPDDEYL